MISLAKEDVYFKPQEGYYKAKDLEDIAKILELDQVMKVHKCTIAEIPRKLQRFPDVTQTRYGFISNGAKIWIVSPDGCYSIWVGRG
jgi:hypothetical protein